MQADGRYACIQGIHDFPLGFETTHLPESRRVSPLCFALLSFMRLFSHFADTFYFIKHTSIIAALFFPPKFLHSSFRTRFSLHPLFRLPFILNLLPQFPPRLPMSHYASSSTDPSAPLPFCSDDSMCSIS